MCLYQHEDYLYPNDIHCGDINTLPIRSTFIGHVKNIGTNTKCKTAGASSFVFNDAFSVRDGSQA